MPEVVSCPKCQRKSRVPDSLVGKKVKCPGCAEIFTADVKGQAAQKKQEAAKKVQAEEEGRETYEVVDEKKKRRRSDDDDDDDRVSDKPISRRRGDDDDEGDRPRTSRTRRDDDDDDDDDDRVTTRRRRYSRDDDDDDDDEPGGAPRRAPAADWSRIRTGISLLLASVLTQIGVVVFLFVGLCCVGASAIGMGGKAGPGGQPPAPGAIAGLGAGILIVMGIYLVGLFAAWAMKVGGSILCLPSPAAFGSKTLALVSLILIGAQTLFSLTQFTINIGANGLAGVAGNNPMAGGLGGMATGGAAVVQVVAGGLGSLAMIAWLFVIGLYIRSIGMCLRNYSLAGTAKGWLITLGVTIALTLIMVVVGIATIGLAGMNFAKQMGAAQAGKPQGPGAAGGALAGAGVVACGLAGIVGIMSLVLLVWYIVMLSQARGSITGRMTR